MSHPIINNQRGFSLIESLVGMSIMAITIAGVASAFLDTSRRSFDTGVMMRTNESAQAVLDLMSWDIRMAGSGMPLGQASYAIASSGIGDAALPVLTSASATNLEVRINESGRDTVLMTDFTPTTTNRSFTVLSSSDIAAGDVVYISDMPRGGAQGLRGTVESVSGNTVTIAAGFVASSGASFSAGSTVARVTTVQYVSPVDDSGITRNPETGALVLVPKSTFQLSYYDAAGTELVPPFTDVIIADELAAIGLSVTVTSDVNLRDGQPYVVTVTQRIGLRNLNLNR